MVPGGAHLGPYVLLREVARGAMGAVYEAQAPDGGRVALKVLAGAASPEALARFDRERRLLAELSEADGFVPLLDAGEHLGRPWLVMPLFAGGSLRDRLRRGPLDVEATVSLGRHLGAALGRAHARGIVHRDLKPENVLLERADDPSSARIADLGVARHFREGLDGARSASLSRSGAMLGTACYMAPEQVVDARRVGPPADVFALAQVLHECLTGATPFARGSLQETMAALVEGRPDPLRAGAPDAPAWLEATLARALALDPARRHADGEAFARALVRGARDRPAPGPRRRAAAALALGTLVLAASAGVAAWAAGRAASPSVAATPSPSPPDGVVRPSGPPAPEVPRVPEPEVAPALAPAAPEIAAPEADLAPAAPRHDEPEADRVPAAPHHDEPAVTPAPAPARPRPDEPAFDEADAGAWQRRGVALSRARDHDGAAEAYRRALALRPNKAIQVILVFALIDAGRHDEAIAEAERAVAAGADPASLHARGAALIAAGRLRGRVDVERALERSPTWPKAQATLSVGRARARDWAGALAAAERALTPGAPPGPALRSRGLARAALGDPAGAREDLERFRAALDPTEAARDTELQAGLARVGAPTDPAPDDRAAADRLVEEAWLARAQGDIVTVRALLDRALRRVPDHAGALATLALDLGAALGLQLLDRAISLAPPAGWQLAARAQLRLARGDLAGAAADVEAASALDALSLDLLRVRALARAGLGELALARADVAQLRRLAPRLVDGDPELLALEREEPR